MFVDFSCLMRSYLERYGVVVVHCKNGRSRSPTVILAHFIISGMKREFATDWLEHAFQAQRPTIASKSCDFPNFSKFFNVTVALAKDVSESAPWISQRIAENAGLHAGGSSYEIARERAADTEILSELPVSAFSSEHVMKIQEMTRSGRLRRRICLLYTSPSPRD